MCREHTRTLWFKQRLVFCNINNKVKQRSSQMRFVLEIEEWCGFFFLQKPIVLDTDTNILIVRGWDGLEVHGSEQSLADEQMFWDQQQNAAQIQTILLSLGLILSVLTGHVQWCRQERPQDVLFPAGQSYDLRKQHDPEDWTVLFPKSSCYPE